MKLFKVLFCAVIITVLALSGDYFKDQLLELDLNTESFINASAASYPLVEGENELEFSVESGFYYNSIDIELYANNAISIFYTLDGSIPTQNSFVYDTPLFFESISGVIPVVYVLRAIAFFPDGHYSPIVTKTYYLCTEIMSRFSTLVFSIVIPEYNLVDKNDLLAEENLLKHGRSAEREAYIEVFTSKGELLVSQSAGIRLYGASSRFHPIKSFKLYARKSYDPDHSYFELPSLLSLDNTGSNNRYKRIVLRNAGNDFAYAYIRDEFAQYLAQNANYLDFEASIPVVTYVNGQYYALHWLHESYCDAYFKEKIGIVDGFFCVIEGSETHMSSSNPEDEDYEPLADSFNRSYYMLSNLDLTEEKNYTQVTSFIDVHNYLDYYALNIIIGNYDWPNNNMKAYKYQANSSLESSGVLDGRWRFLPHDMDYSLGIYGEDKTSASYNSLKDLLSPDNPRFSPLFTALMKRDDCREYFLNTTRSLLSSVFSPQMLLKLLDEFNSNRIPEHTLYYLPFLIQQKAFTYNEEQYYTSLDDIRFFCIERKEYLESHLSELLG